MNKRSVIIVGAAVGLICSLIAVGQPVNRGGLQQVLHDTSLTGSGTVPAPLGIRPCTTGQSLIYSSGAWGCGTAGFTNTAGANVVMKSDGTNAVPSSATDTGALVTFTTPVQVPTLDSMLLVRDSETNISLVGLTLIHDWDPFSGGATTPVVFVNPDPADTVVDGILKPSATVCLGAIGLHRLPRLRRCEAH